MTAAYGRKAPIVTQRQTVKTADYTVVVNTDSGKIFASALDGITYTLPAIAAGEVYTFINIGLDGAAAINISPNASDGIMYVGSNTDDKDLINTKATAKRGDMVTLKSSEAGSVAWQVANAIGIWAKEA